jgi:hypothetical protein
MKIDTTVQCEFPVSPRMLDANIVTGLHRILQMIKLTSDCLYSYTSKL